jgi:hypothetical protein
MFICLAFLLILATLLVLHLHTIHQMKGKSLLYVDNHSKNFQKFNYNYYDIIPKQNYA